VKKTEFPLDEKSSVSLVSLLNRESTSELRPATARLLAVSSDHPTRVAAEDTVALQLEASGDLARVRAALRPGDELQPLDDPPTIWTARVPLARAPLLVAAREVTRIHTKKRSAPTLYRVADAIGLRPRGQPRSVAETGQGVLVGIVDSGFDLGHPMFRDAAGNLRVRALLDQQTGLTFDRAQLVQGWGIGNDPGKDASGHGTHVASIAGGSLFGEYEGIAPGVEYLLVKTNFVDTDKAVAWIFRQAGTTPCVVNLSFGHHFGAHDGSSPEERLHQRLTGPGKILVVSAGNEREARIHIGGLFAPRQVEEIPFSIAMQNGEVPSAVITGWHDEGDRFEVSVLTPWGNVLPLPALGLSSRFEGSAATVELARRAYPWSHAHQIQIDLSFRPPRIRSGDLRGWRLRIECLAATSGRLDAWFSNDGFGAFGDHRLLEEARTVGLPATGAGSLAVASFVDAVDWNSDVGAERDERLVVSRASPFSSRGPTRDNRPKPDIAAPGQYVTAALAAGSELAGWSERALGAGRLLTIEGTSMAAPVVTGVIALMLQRNGRLDVAAARAVLQRTAKHDTATGALGWTPDYGFGKLFVPAAVNEV
jgi:subtilisin family serine protease